MRNTAECRVCIVEDSVSHNVMHDNMHGRSRKTLFTILESYRVQRNLKSILDMGECRCGKERAIVVRALARVMCVTY